MIILVTIRYIARSKLRADHLGKERGKVLKVFSKELNIVLEIRGKVWVDYSKDPDKALDLKY